MPASLLWWTLLWTTVEFVVDESSMPLATSPEDTGAPAPVTSLPSIVTFEELLSRMPSSIVSTTWKPRIVTHDTDETENPRSPPWTVTVSSGAASITIGAVEVPELATSTVSE